tara:strand:+ start:231 stop:461 length:231 start_codon:yes stop_codon:yes gene_type:complete
MSNIISLAKKLPLAQQVERDMRMYGYDPYDPDSEDAYWSDFWCENDLEEDEPLVVEMKLGSRKFSVSITRLTTSTD